MAIRCVRFRQSGGFAGLVRSSELSGNDLNAAESKALERHLDRPKVAPVPGDKGGRDLLVYELEVETEEGQVRLEFDESDVPAALAPLIEKLAARAKATKP